MKNKILFTSAGRRLELIQAYKDAAKKLCMDAELHGCDINNNTQLHVDILITKIV